jgi:hypothetical protein
MIVFTLPAATALQFDHLIRTEHYHELGAPGRPLR